MFAIAQSLWTIPDRLPTDPGCFVIPSYALRSRVEPTKPTCAQIELAAEWWKRFPGAKLIMSTGDNQRLGISNAAVMATYAEDLGVPREQIIEEDRSRTTFENLAYSMEIVQEQGLAQPTLVTLDLYTRRAVATAKRLGWQDFFWLSVYAEGQPAHGYKWLQTYSRFTIFYYEVGATIFSKFVGWV